MSRNAQILDGCEITDANIKERVALMQDLIGSGMLGSGGDANGKGKVNEAWLAGVRLYSAEYIRDIFKEYLGIDLSEPPKRV
jgi:hypothetical protein